MTLSTTRLLFLTTVMTVCPVPGIDTFSSPKYIYPMCDLSYAFEVVGGDTSLTQMEQCGLHFNGTHPDISCTPLNLDGLALPYCDLEVSASNILQEFSFVVMFKPYSVIGTSTVIDYKYFGALQETREVVLFIDNGIITFRVLGPGGAETNYTSQLNMSVSIESGYWTYVAISKDYLLGKLEMAMKTDTPDVASTYVVTSGGEYFPSEMSLNVPGILRVGESHSGGMGNFVGEIICLNIFDTDGLADVKYYTEFVNGCNPPWNPPPTAPPGIKQWYFSADEWNIHNRKAIVVTFVIKFGIKTTIMLYGMYKSRYEDEKEELE